jgi:hypothetical protein
MSEQDDTEREFDIKWADGAELKEPSARARMLAARWKENPPTPQPFRAEAEPRTPRRSSWVSTAIVFGSVAAIVLLLGYVNLRASY